jgi:citrate lyase subunit beta/citryl-CoA lyase
VSHLRSLLFCPATEPRRVAKLPQLGMDAVAIDLEDAVALEQKASARAAARAALDTLADTRAYVRVNHPSTGFAESDVRAVTHPNLDGLVIPKVESADTVREVARWLDEAEVSAGLAAGRVGILILLESGLGVHRAAEILAASGRVERAIFGTVDYMLDVGMDAIDVSDGGEELLFAQSSIVLSSRVAGCRAPLDGPFIDIGKPDRFARACAQSRRLGFAGRMVIHPSQIEPANCGYVAGPEEVAQARRVVTAFAEAEAEGRAAILVDGRLVDYPIAARAARIVETASVPAVPAP